MNKNVKVPSSILGLGLSYLVGIQSNLMIFAVIDFVFSKIWEIQEVYRVSNLLKFSESDKASLFSEIIKEAPRRKNIIIPK